MERKVTFRKLERHEKIRPSDMHSLDEGKHLNPIFMTKTIGQTPSDFANDQSFWRITSIEG